MDPSGYVVTLTIHPDRFAVGASEIDAVVDEIVEAVNTVAYVNAVTLVTVKERT